MYRSDSPLRSYSLHTTGRALRLCAPLLSALWLACASAPTSTPTPTPASEAAEAAAAPGPAGVDIDREHLAAQLTPYIESFGRGLGPAHQFSGFVLVAHRGEPIYARGFGYADRDAKRPNTIDTSFRIGSVTKQFTAVAILLLEQDGALRVTDTLGKYLPDVPATWAGVTIHQLLTHTSGIPSYTSVTALTDKRAEPHTVQQIVDSVRDTPLEFEPGAQWAYSNTGYVLLGAIIERVSGQPYAAFMRERVFSLAGLTQTEIGDAPGAADRALAYQAHGDDLAPAHPIDMSVPHAAGAARSTARDLVTWHQALVGDRLLGAEAKQKLYRPEQKDYAYGWMVHDVKGHRVVQHGGGIDGFACHYVRVLDADLVVVAWSNNELGAASQIANGAMKAAFGDTLEPIEPVTPTKMDPELLAKAVGSYALTDASRDTLNQAGVPTAVVDSVLTVAIRVDGDDIRFAPVGQPDIGLTPVEGGALISPAHRVKVELVRDDAGAITGLRVSQGPMTLDYTRVPVK
jgi:CubicO group peptidase (beta-lactamase class C family)